MASKGRAKCPSCGGGPLRRQAVKRTIAVGLRKVIDGSTMTSVCTKCGEYDLSHAALLQSERRAALTVLRDAPHVDGAVLKFARKALGLTQTELARALGTAAETISRWEAASTVDRTTSLAMERLLQLPDEDKERLHDLTDGDDGRPPISRTG